MALSEKAIQQRRDAFQQPMTHRIIKYAAKAQVRIFRLTNGRIGSNWRVGAGFRKPVPTLLLDHVGRKSGQEFVTPLLYLADGKDIVIVASQGGSPKHPQWYPNLVAQPDAAVELRGEGVRRVRARTASAEEKAVLWPRLVAMYADFEDYQTVAGDRDIPVVILEPR